MARPNIRGVLFLRHGTGASPVAGGARRSWDRRMTVRGLADADYMRAAVKLRAFHHRAGGRCASHRWDADSSDSVSHPCRA